MGRTTKAWVWTKEMDALLREAYRVRRRGITARLERDLHVSRHSIGKRARHLGLTRPAEAAWTPAETRIIEELGYLSVWPLQRRLFKETGVLRSLGAIAMKRKRMRLRGEFGGYTWSQTAEGLGVSPHKVARWCEEGKLRSIVRNPEASHTSDERHWIEERDLRSFIIEHPEELRLGTVDAPWFISILTKDGGATAGQVRRTEPTRKDFTAQTTVVPALAAERAVAALASQITETLKGRVPVYVWANITEEILTSGTLPAARRRRVMEDDTSEEAAWVRALEALHRLREPLSKLGAQRLQKVLSLVRLTLGGVQPESLLEAA
ncbi:MAG: hypothetical protein HYT87_13125 [Nitrospirae bacterium]|nr:hypothetical protein [Nitrospirota bacterium]